IKPYRFVGEYPSNPLVRSLNISCLLQFSFTDDKNVQFQMGPESYLIMQKEKNVCLGILNGKEVGLRDKNVIGDISMQDKLVIYDNERKMVGWAAVKTCKRKV
ncbi:aspartic proteinase asp1, partial [Phtheirospermum japonicum]